MMTIIFVIIYYEFLGSYITYLYELIYYHKFYVDGYGLVKFFFIAYLPLVILTLIILYYLI